MCAKPVNGFDKRPQDRGKGGGRKKIFTILKEHGYTKEDISQAFQELAFYNERELLKVVNNKRQPMIARIIAQQFQQALEKKDWNKVKDLIEHVIGRPSQSVQQTVTTVEQPLLPNTFNTKKKQGISIKPKEDV